jgi:hypothetical protein
MVRCAGTRIAILLWLAMKRMDRVVSPGYCHEFARSNTCFVRAGVDKQFRICQMIRVDRNTTDYPSSLTKKRPLILVMRGSAVVHSRLTTECAAALQFLANVAAGRSASAVCGCVLLRHNRSKDNHTHCAHRVCSVNDTPQIVFE